MKRKDWRGWTLDHVKRLLEQGKIRGFTVHGKREDKPSKRAKYGNNKVVWNGMVFDSKKEYKRYRELLLMLKAGEIGQLERQVCFTVIEKSETQRATRYIADHVYINAKTGERIIEDVKSEATRKLPTYIMKKKLMKTIHNIDILEV